MLLNEFLRDAAPFELIPQLKELRPSRGIIVMAGEGEMNLEPEVRKPGILYYMLKPFVGEELKIILAHLSGESLPLLSRVVELFYQEVPVPVVWGCKLQKKAAGRS